MLLLVLALLLCAGTATAADGDVVSYSYPAFNATTTRDDSLIAATNTTVLTTARLLFDSEFPHDFNVSEGFLLLSDTIDVWPDATGSAGAPAHEASFNTSFTISSRDPPVAFVVLLHRLPPIYGPADDGDGDDGNATNSLVNVRVGTVMSYGLNVTVTPNRTAPSSTTVWVQYNAVVHQLSVYVAVAGEPRPPGALLKMPLYLAGGRTSTQTALVGFFAAAIRDIIVGVRDWELTVERLGGDGGKKGTSWLVILLAVLGSVAASAAVVSVLVCRLMHKRRRARDMESTYGRWSN
uniref:Legume lectin domain-containing protein n=1 Tax=Leersia perrieri TaxID=77586 RepID=A0A0D9XIC8_9ORYZ